MIPSFLAWMSWGIVGKCTKSTKEEKKVWRGVGIIDFSLGHVDFEMPLRYPS